MANRTDPSAATVHGTNPQNLVEQIVRTKIHNSTYWKEHCFALTTETVIDKCMELRAVGGTYGGARQPSQFICLVLKLLQIQPDAEVVREYILQNDSKYLRLLGAFYLRLTGKADQVYRYLEPLYNDLRKVRELNADGGYSLSHMDAQAESMLHKDYLFDIVLPRLPKRVELETQGLLGPRQSGLDARNIAELEATIEAERAEVERQRATQAEQEAAEKEQQDAARSAEEERRARTRPDERRERPPGDTTGRLRLKDGDPVRDRRRSPRRDGDEGLSMRPHEPAGRPRRGSANDDEHPDSRSHARRHDEYRDRRYSGDRDGYRERDRGYRDYPDRGRREGGHRGRDAGGRYYRDDDDRWHERERERGRGERGDRYDRDADKERARERASGDKQRERGDRADRGDVREKVRTGKKKRDGAEELSVEETNKLRAELGLPPLK